MYGSIVRRSAYLLYDGSLYPITVGKLFPSDILERLMGGKEFLSHRNVACVREGLFDAVLSDSLSDSCVYFMDRVAIILCPVGVRVCFVGVTMRTRQSSVVSGTQ